MKYRTSKYEYLAFLIISIAVLIRFIIGLQCPFTLKLAPGFVDSDLAVTALMGKHVLEKGEFPFFFWGQNWFGGLEALLYAIPFYFFGVYAWPMRLVTLFLFALFSMVTYLLARDVHSERVGLGALLWCLCAPLLLTKYSLVPHTHYLETPTFGSLVLWIAVRIRKSSSEKNKKILYLALGMVGGLAWWASPLMMYYFLPITLYLFIYERVRALKYGLMLSLPLFFAGGWPFFYYYAKDPFSSLLSMGQGFHWNRLLQGLKGFFFAAAPKLMDVLRYERFGNWAIWVVALFLIFVTLYYFAKARHSEAYLMGALLLMTILIFSTSLQARRPKDHYVVALYSFFPIACSFVVLESKRFLKKIMIPLYAIYLFAQGIFIWDMGTKDAPASCVRTIQLMSLIDTLKSKNLKYAYADYFLGSTEISFLSKESIICSPRQNERYDPYMHLLNETDRPAFISDSEVKKTLKRIGGHCQTDAVGGYTVTYNFEEPQAQYQQINPNTIKATASDYGEGMKNTLDRNMETAWTSGDLKRFGMWVQFDLGKNYSLGMLRLWNKGWYHAGYPNISLTEVSQDGKVWKEVSPKIEGGFFYWSGPRIYPWEWGYRWEVRFGPVEARYIRVKQLEDSKRSEWIITEAYLYEQISSFSLGRQGEDAMLNKIKALGLERVYADRWISAQIRKRFSDTISTIEPFVSASRKKKAYFKSRVVEWEPKIGFVLEKDNANLFQEMMRKEGRFLKREDFERWVLFYFDSWAEKEEEIRNDPGWWWMGLGVVKINTKKRSEYFRSLAQNKEAEDKKKESLIFYKRALREYKNNQIARRGLIKLLKGQGKKDEAFKHERILKHQTEPLNECNIEFSNGVKFLGYRFKKNQLRSGESTSANYYWSLKKDIKSPLGVFVHVFQDSHVFQGDHKLLKWNPSVWPTLENEIFREKEFLKVPQEMPEGEYKIKLGLFDLGTGKRIKVKKTSLSEKDNAVIIGKIYVKK